MKALTFSSFGDSRVLEYIDVPYPSLVSNSVIVKNQAIGLNYADIYRRKGNYHLKGNPPFIAGYEGAGEVVESASDKYPVRSRVAYTDMPFANAEYILVHEEHVIPLPEKIDYQTAAAILLQGLTAQYLVNDSYKVSDTDTVLIHAAAGGVGQFLVQMCKQKGAYVIGLTRSKNKLSVITDCGADIAILLDEGWEKLVLAKTNGLGVNVVYDSVGSTLEKSFDATRECGTVVFYGMSGGDPLPVNPRMLMDTSKTLTGGDLWSYLKTAGDRIKRANSLFSAVLNNEITVKKPVCFALKDGKDAHDMLEFGKTDNKILLIP
jgi:NADPH:quinone reductase